MFVRFTKKDGTLVWLNANLIVTIEAVRNGGAIVVPVGDGLDYEVRESVETIIPMIEDAQSEMALVPVPTRDALVPSPGTVAAERREEAEAEDERRQKQASKSRQSHSHRQGRAKKQEQSQTQDEKPEAAAPEQEAAPEAAAPEPEADAQGGQVQENGPLAEAEPAEQPSFEEPAVVQTDSQPETTEAESANAVAAVASIKAEMEKAAEAAEKKPAKRVRREKPKLAPAGTPATAGERKLPVRRRTSRRTPLEMSAEDIDRLRSMAPRTVKRVINSLKSGFKVSDSEATVRALIENNIIEADENGRVTWLPVNG